MITALSLPLPHPPKMGVLTGGRGLAPISSVSCVLIKLHSLKLLLALSLFVGGRIEAFCCVIPPRADHILACFTSYSSPLPSWVQPSSLDVIVSPAELTSWSALFSCSPPELAMAQPVLLCHSSAILPQSQVYLGSSSCHHLCPKVCWQMKKEPRSLGEEWDWGAALLWGTWRRGLGLGPDTWVPARDGSWSRMDAGGC